MANVSVGVLSIFDHETHEWALYKGRLEQWFLANEVTSEVDKSGAKRRAILLSSLSENSYRLIRDLALPKDVGSLTYLEVARLLDGHFKTKKCGFAERHRFHSAGQELGENLAQWAARVRGLAMHCGFESSTLNEQLRDRFVLGMACGPERDRLFSEPMEKEFTLEKALQLAEGIRCAREGARQSAPPAPAPPVPQLMEVHKMAARTGPAAGPQQGPGVVSSQGSSEKCVVCGFYGHYNKQCRFKNALCRKCGEKGHLKRVCRKSGSNP